MKLQKQKKEEELKQREVVSIHITTLELMYSKQSSINITSLIQYYDNPSSINLSSLISNLNVTSLVLM